jgi:phospholipase/carboxylesterase
MAPMGRQWFNLTFRDPGEMTRGVAQAGPLLDAFLSAQLERLRLPSSALGLVGFSQGTMVALAVGLTRNPSPAAIVGYSGALANAEALAERSGSGPAILLVHGDADEVIPVDAMLIAREQLAQAGLPVEWHVAQGIGHGIDQTGLKLGGAFLKQAFAASRAI